MANRFRFVACREGGILRGGEPTKASYGFEIIESCVSCPHREDRLFCNLPPAAVQALSAMTSPAAEDRNVVRRWTITAGSLHFVRWSRQAFYIVRRREKPDCQNRGPWRGTGFARHDYRETLPKLQVPEGCF